MIRALYTAASGMSAQQANLDTVANNLANSATTGFRQRRLQFEDMIYQNMITPGSPQTQQRMATVAVDHPAGSIARRHLRVRSHSMAAHGASTS